ncbi:MAG: HNH endonuclease [Lachnospiraceae bacterium]|nr:HNH endonuclease [Lachnospiraceae bacterium]
MSNNRDDFSISTKELLANRVGLRCSNPNCRKLTRGANDDPSKTTNIGVAAHICAAAKGGPRYNESMSAEERKAPDNGIWLCQNCAKLIDSDTNRYTIELLRAWKQIAEEYAMTEVATNTVGNTVDDDISLIKFYVQCFDRPAFQDEISQEGRMEDFDKAIEDTIIALNTGILRTRDGVIIKQSEGKSTINNPMWRQKLDNIGDMLASIRRRLKIAEEESAFTKTNSSDNEVFYFFRDRELGEWFNITREEILKVLSSVCREAGIRELHFMRRKYYRGW